MAKKGVIALMACVFALCLALVGCGGGGAANSADNKAAFVGTWDLVEMNQDGEVTGADDLDTLKSLGLEVYVNFNEDGTMVLALFGEPIEGTWEATSSTAGTIEMEGQSVSMSIADSKLNFEQEGASLTFEKGEAKDAPTASSNESSSAVAEDTESSESAAVEEESSEVAEESSEPSESESAEASAEATEPSESESAEAAESSESESAEASESESSSSTAE